MHEDIFGRLPARCWVVHESLFYDEFSDDGGFEAGTGLSKWSPACVQASRHTCPTRWRHTAARPAMQTIRSRRPSAACEHPCKGRSKRVSILLTSL